MSSHIFFGDTKVEKMCVFEIFNSLEIKKLINFENLIVI
jgi:hypothetical protein